MSDTDRAAKMAADVIAHLRRRRAVLYHGFVWSFALVVLASALAVARGVVDSETFFPIVFPGLRACIVAAICVAVGWGKPVGEIRVLITVVIAVDIIDLFSGSHWLLHSLSVFIGVLVGGMVFYRLGVLQRKLVALAADGGEGSY